MCGRIEGNVENSNAEFIDSVIFGNMNISTAASNKENAYITGDITAKSTSIDEGAIIQGYCCYLLKPKSIMKFFHVIF